MLKKRYNLQKQIILKHNYRKLFFNILFKKSLKKNHFLEPLERLSYFAQDDYVRNLYFKFSTFQKLTCLISLSHKVHSKSYHYSRFFLNKQLDKLSISNTVK